MLSKGLWKTLGPGLLYAGAAIGVSHLVQSTRAGADYGYQLLWIVIAANLIKYPFFEFAPRYVAATQSHLIEGYRKLGKWALYIFALLTITTMFAVQGAITVVTAGLLSNIFNVDLDTTLLSVIVLSAAMLVLLTGKFALLDKTVKIIIVILTISTLFAVFAAWSHPFEKSPEAMGSFDWLKLSDIAFLIAFVGWMPAPIDISVWQSLWGLEKWKQLNRIPDYRQSLIDFLIGFIGTILIALGFLMLGSLVMYGSGVSLSPNGTEFAGQLIQMYTMSIGPWAYYIIAIASFSTIFSTTLTVLDAYPRSLHPTLVALFPFYEKKAKNENKSYRCWIMVIVAGTLLMIAFMASSMQYMVDLATTMSFITAPVLAYMNLRVITAKGIPKTFRPGPWMKGYSIFGIVLLGLFALVFLIWRFF